jgi:hypothetical protein
MADTSPEPNLAPPITPADGPAAGVAPVAAPAVAAAAACKIHFKAVGSAPILRKNKFKIDMHESFATVRVSDASRGRPGTYTRILRAEDLVERMLSAACVWLRGCQCLLRGLR